MPQYILVYLGGDRPASPEQGKQHFAQYQQWLSALGDAVISPANPLKNTHTVAADGNATPGGASTMSGYTIIQAESMPAALKIAQSCPFLNINGTLEVSELGQMPG